MLPGDGKSIGWGLFATDYIEPRELIAMYIGEKISTVEWNMRVKDGQGGYGLYVNQTTVKDCRSQYSSHECWASAANCAKNIIHKSTRKKAAANATIKIVREIPYIFSTTSIEPGSEILLDTYGKGYRMIPFGKLAKI